MIEVKVYKDGELINESSGECAVLLTQEGKKTSSFVAGGGVVSEVFPELSRKLAEAAVKASVKAGGDRMYTSHVIAEMSQNLRHYGAIYTFDAYEEHEDGSGQGVGTGMESGEH